MSPGYCRPKGNLVRIVESGNRMFGKLRQFAATRDRVTDGGHFDKNMSGREENTFGCLAADHARVERNVSAGVDRCNDRLQGDIETVKAAAGRSGLTGCDDKTHTRRDRRRSQLAHTWRRRRKIS